MARKKKSEQALSTELAGGAGFTFEDLVVAYYLAALLREEHAMGQTGVVTRVAVQQKQAHPMDDLVVEFDVGGSARRLGLQLKRQLRITANNADFKDIMAAVAATRSMANFQPDADAYGFATENIAFEPLRSFNRLIDWAKASSSTEDFVNRFEKGGAAAAAERTMRQALSPLTGAKAPGDEAAFYKRFVALHFPGLGDGGPLRAEIVNRLQEMLVPGEPGQDILLFDRLCRLAREGAASGRSWTRQSLLADFRGTVRLKIAPSYARDIELLQEFSKAGLLDISEEISGFHVRRPALEASVRDRLPSHRLVSLSGIPGSGKSAMLKCIASADAVKGPILFLKSDRLEGNSWLTFGAALGLSHRGIGDLLAEIGSAGTPILFIDGIDRIRPDQRRIITDILRAIEANEHLANWKVLASSRDQGLEAYRAWFPGSFYRGTGIGDISVTLFSDEEAKALVKERPSLKRLLFGPPAVREIARRPFFAAVLARSFPDDTTSPQTEVDLIEAWWARAGHDAPQEMVPQRQRALLDLSQKGVRKLGKNIAARDLKDATFAHVADLQNDLIIRPLDGGATYSFTHDIFFEWVFFRHLIELGDNWHTGVTEAGEPPLLGRVVGLLAQSAISTPGRWTEGYRHLESQTLRPQWRREWLTAPPFTPAFAQGQEEFFALLREGDFALLEKLLVWFQAQHTVPSPLVLQNAALTVEGNHRIQVADLLSWPSDFESWGRLLDWLLPLAPSVPARLIPSALEVFSVWQNALADLKNDRSGAIIAVCEGWLQDLEGTEYPEELTIGHGRWDALGREARSALAKSLRVIILRSARSYPAVASALYARATASRHMRREAFADLVGFTAVMADVSPESVVALTKAELVEELPDEKLARQERDRRRQLESMKRLRAIPEDKRTDQHKRALEHMPFVSLGYDHPARDDTGLAEHHSYYFPESPLHEPFASLFAKKPETALGLVRDLANHATKGWHQSQLLHSKQFGTPIPLTLEFPWGSQRFWGDWHVYSWCMGQLAPNPLQCAFLALSYWAFKEIEKGRPADEIIRAVIDGNECYAVLGLALMLALEVYDVSETTLPLVACQRLWHHDLARRAHEPTRNLDLLGFGVFSRLTGEKAKAKEFLDGRQSLRREVRELAMRFAISAPSDLRKRFKEALTRFPSDLPFELEEQRTSESYTAGLRETAERWAGLGDIKNYRKHEAAGEQVMVSYESPQPLTPAQEQRLERSTASLQEYSAIGWAVQSLTENKLAEGLSLADAIAFARKRDNATVLVQRDEAGEHSAQSALSAIAAVAIRLGSAEGKDHEWAWDVMSRIAGMTEPDDTFYGSKIPWHPANYLITALVHDRRSTSPRPESVRRLFELTAHPLEDVAKVAFSGLFLDANEHVRWVAGQLAMDFSMRHRFEITEEGSRVNTADRAARGKSLERALGRLDESAETPFRAMPPAWIKTGKRRRRGEDGEAWDEPAPFFDARSAAHLFALFPIEAWCTSSTFKPMIAEALRELSHWTAARVMPEWLGRKQRRRSEIGSSYLIEWDHALGTLIARAAPFFEPSFVLREFLAPFLTDDEDGLGVLAEFSAALVTRHVFDSLAIPPGTFELLDACVERAIRDDTFRSGGYRAGEVHGYDMPKMIEALLFVNVNDAPGAARFANGDWSEINTLMPLVTRLVIATGWSSFVMEKFLTLCERAGDAYPVLAFNAQVGAVLSAIANAKGGWVGTMLPARIAGVVQKLADANFPLNLDQAQGLLRLLDALIDFGDRRSAALEQTEAFRGIQRDGVPSGQPHHVSAEAATAG